jgi:hypothetical protein
MIKKIFFKLFLLLILATDSFGSVSLIMQNYSGANGTQITIPVKVKDFNSIISAQGSIQFDQAVLSYTSVQAFGLPGMNVSNFGTSQVSSGKLAFLWMDGTLAGVTLADSSTIFSITFTIIGTAGQFSALTFVNAPTPIEIVNAATVTETVLMVNGNVTVITSTGMSKPNTVSILSTASPNPFNVNTKISFFNEIAGNVIVTVFDLCGRIVWISEKYYAQGAQVISWDGTDNNGSYLSNGMYVCTIETVSVSTDIKLMMVR